MCGIFAYFPNSSNNSNNSNNSVINIDEAIKYANKMSHRGPDSSGIEIINGNYIIHHRLSIIDPKSGHQPLKSSNNKLFLTVNGEIFNYKYIKKTYPYSKYDYLTNSDCEVILALYNSYCVEKNDNLTDERNILKVLENLDGQFSFVLYDSNNNSILVGRDPFGITSLYWGKDKYGGIAIASEAKSLVDFCFDVQMFPAGHYLYFRNDDRNIMLEPIEYFSKMSFGKWVSNYKAGIIINKDYNFMLESAILKGIRDIFTAAVEKRMMSDVPFGVLLSGGLDSSIVASITSKIMKEKQDIYGINPLHTFSVGLENAPDLLKARIVANFLGTVHHEYTFSLEEGWSMIEEVIRKLETYDITTIRASTPMYIMAKNIRDDGFKMVLSGEGSDELLGGYLYFHAAPDNETHQKECMRRLLELSYFDCLRADKSTMGNSVEVRVPFLDTAIVDFCVNINKDIKAQQLPLLNKYNCISGKDIKTSNTDNFGNSNKKKIIEKYIFRKAFDEYNSNGKEVYLPFEILWRQKEQFSDGVGYGWIDYLKDMTSNLISDEEFNLASEKYSYNTPTTKEAFYYRKVFEKYYPNRANIVKKWIPNTSWAGVSADPSGRFQKVHEAHITST